MKNFMVFLAVMMLSVQVCVAEKAVIDRLPVSEKAVALSVEDISSVKEFEQVLSLCQQEEIHATFFETSQFLIQHEGVALKVLAQGHEFGNHGTMGEGWLDLSSDKAWANFAEAENILKRMTGKASLLIKPPQAYTENVIQGALQYKPDALLVRGIDSSNWSFKDLTILEGKATAIQNGDIISINMRMPNAHILLPVLIKNIKAQNYKIVSVSELVSMRQNESVPVREQTKEKHPFHVVSSFSLDKPYIALTFDDGGSRPNVVEILDVLNEYGIHSTFFLTGEWAVNNPDLVRRIERRTRNS